MNCPKKHGRMVFVDRIDAMRSWYCYRCGTVVHKRDGRVAEICP